MAKCFTKLCGLWNKNRGNTSIVILCTIIIIILLSAVITDIGYSAVMRYQLANGARMTALKGAELLAVDKTKAEESIRAFAVSKVRDLNRLEIKVSGSGKELTVSMGRSFDYIFLKHIGFKRKQICSRMTAKLSSISSYKGIRPFAVESRYLVMGKRCELTNKVENESKTIPFTAIKLGDDTYSTDIIYGYGKKVSIGDYYYTMEGDNDTEKESLLHTLESCTHKPGCTYLEYNKSCPRLMVVPVVQSRDEEIKRVCVIGFSTFFMESMESSNDSLRIKGRFIRQIVDSDTSDDISDFGLMGIRLVD